MPPVQLSNPPKGYTRPATLSQSPFSLRTDPGTDLWRKPPSTYSNSAPSLSYKVPLASFKRARVTLKANWRTLYDQGGLVMMLNSPAAILHASSETSPPQPRWIKSGIEYTHGAPHISTVACDRWADWSLTPLPDDQHGVTIEMEREVKVATKEASSGEGDATEEERRTSTLWVYAVEGTTRGPNGERQQPRRRPIREITWVFENVTNKHDAQDEKKEHKKAKTATGMGTMCSIGVYVAKPNADVDDKERQLEVEFRDFVIETWDGDLEL